MNDKIEVVVTNVFDNNGDLEVDWELRSEKETRFFKGVLNEVEE